MNECAHVVYMHKKHIIIIMTIINLLVGATVFYRNLYLQSFRYIASGEGMCTELDMFAHTQTRTHMHTP